MTALRRVLCVDDEDDILEVVRLCLELCAGLEVFCCHSGREALEQISTIEPDLILLDVMMPILDGPATLMELRRSSAGATIPVAFMTARVRQTERDEYIRLGASGVVAKPFDPVTLPQDIDRIWRSIQDKQEQLPRTPSWAISTND